MSEGRTYRIEVLRVSALSALRSFNVEEESTFDALKQAAVVLFGAPFVKDDFNYEGLGTGGTGRQVSYRVFHRRMDALFCVLTVENLSDPGSTLIVF